MLLAISIDRPGRGNGNLRGAGYGALRCWPVSQYSSWTLLELGYYNPLPGADAQNVPAARGLL